MVVNLKFCTTAMAVSPDKDYKLIVNIIIFS